MRCMLDNLSYAISLINTMPYGYSLIAKNVPDVEKFLPIHQSKNLMEFAYSVLASPLVAMCIATRCLLFQLLQIPKVR